MYNLYSDLVERFNFCGNIYNTESTNLHMLVYYSDLSLIIKETELLLSGEHKDIKRKVDIMEQSSLPETSRKEKAKMTEKVTFETFGKEEMKEPVMKTSRVDFERENKIRNESKLRELIEYLKEIQEKVHHVTEDFYVYGFEDFKKDKQMKRNCSNLLSSLSSVGTDIVSVWPGKTAEEDVLVTLTKKKITSIPKSFPSPDNSRSYPVLQKIYGQESEEEKILFEKEKDRSIRMSRGERTSILNVINKHSKVLMQRHSNLTIISPSNYVSHKNGQRIETQPCIVLYCTFKGVIPLGETYFPRELGGYVVDVREGLAIPCGSQNYCDPLSMGCSIGLKGRKSAGSIGLFVQEEDFKPGFITCFHVLFGSDLGLSESARTYYAAQGQKHVVQESDEDVQESVQMTDVNNSSVQASTVPELRSSSLRQCGIVRDVFLGTSTVAFEGSLINVGVDAAYIEITSRNPCVAKFAEKDECRGKCISDFPIGDVLEEVTEKDEKYAIHKCGRTSKFTKGMFETLGNLKMYKDISDFDKGFTDLPNQYQILSTYGQPFLEPGDSGSAVFMQTEDNKLHCIGIGVSTLHPSGKYGFVTPIKAVLKALQPQLEARTFQATNNCSINSNGQ